MALDVRVTWDKRDCLAQLDAIGKNAEFWARYSVDAAARAAKEAAEGELLSQAHYSGTKKTKTPSVAPEPPATWQGHLVGSLRTEAVTRPSRWTWQDAVAPHTVYAAIQETGGEMHGHPFMHWVEDGIRHKASLVVLPARPYMRPARDRAAIEFQQTVVYGWSQALEV